MSCQVWREPGAGHRLQRQAPQQRRHRQPELAPASPSRRQPQPATASQRQPEVAISGFSRYLCFPPAERIALQEATGAAHTSPHSPFHSLSLSPFLSRYPSLHDRHAMRPDFTEKCAGPDKHITDRDSSWRSSSQGPVRKKHVVRVFLRAFENRISNLSP